ncbi:ABC-type branched-subunit amino acid transport system substrate-binding protein [Sphingomonas vulcanisoli]|uniref:ABC-type branched-subunit amino acid transport system substrate-binding protein n=1 Tax=Sphingomonas vulcanisoli TaxID=1658060 RepID=A0ABX0TTC0_9SPHN|nr:ABC transporter substrate-binding protein [Sphingomonas vulcanisoli]NIJ07745.1 ABC-type branched-subunit amino acid transport system substrate-binding protein [Sphingomonas vulcanisoli]
MAKAAKSLPPVALLLPLSGVHAALGRSMARAAGLAQGLEKKALIILDTGGTPEGAGAAARQALKQGAGIVFGPLLSAEAGAVLAAVGTRVPVVSFSNDPALLDSGLFLLGITADQAVAPLLRYARGRGVRRVALAVGSDSWSAQIAAAATRVAAAEGLELQRGPGSQPDALLVGTIAEGAQQGPAARAAGVQLLGAFSGINGSQEPLAAIEGAWLSAPDPTRFADFAARFEAQVGAPPGVIAGLAYDAAGIAVALRKSGGEDRSALLSPTGFPGVCGAVRFRENGSADRAMAILAVEQGRFRVIVGGASA